jgi:hypothetical protein
MSKRLMVLGDRLKKLQRGSSLGVFGPKGLFGAVLKSVSDTSSPRARMV